MRSYHGAGDPLVEQDQLAGWASVTSGGFSGTVRPGGHFHVTTDVAELVADVVLSQGPK